MKLIKFSNVFIYQKDDKYSSYQKKDIFVNPLQIIYIKEDEKGATQICLNNNTILEMMDSIESILDKIEETVD